MDKWDKLIRVLNMADEKTIKELESKLNKDEGEVCMDGFTNAVYPLKSKNKLENGAGFGNFLETIGFTREERLKERGCVINGCPYYCQSLTFMFNHFVGYHKVPMGNTTKLIPFMKSDDRTPKTSSKIKLQTLHMNAD